MVQLEGQMTKLSAEFYAGRVAMFVTGKLDGRFYSAGMQKIQKILMLFHILY